jgi:hypothetical protein
VIANASLFVLHNLASPIDDHQQPISFRSRSEHGIHYCMIIKRKIAIKS